MSTIPSSIVSVTISRETTAVSQASFGVPGIIAEFATNKTTTTFDRYRYYASLTEMAEDGWTDADDVYDAAVAIFSQNPVVSQILVGRKDTADTSWAVAFNAIQAQQDDWYGFTIIPDVRGKIVLSADLIASNSVAITVNTHSITPVVYASSHLATMNAVVAAIESAFSGCDAYLDPVDTTNRTIVIYKYNTDVDVTVATVTLGASQPTVTKSNTEEYSIKESMVWAETQMKLFGFSTNDANAYNGGATSDLGYFAKNAAYDRTFSCYHATLHTYMEQALLGEELPIDPGASTFCYKTLSGITADTLTTSKVSALLAKNYNIYNTVGGVNLTRNGLVASGENIDIIRNLDYLQSLIQTSIFSNLVNIRKIPFDDSGILLIVGTLNAALNQAAREGILQQGSIAITYPKYADISTLNKTARNLPDISFTALLLGAVRTVQIDGVVSL